MNEAWLGGLAGGFGGLHDVLRAVIARKQQEARDAEGNEDRDMRRLAQMAALRTAGIVPASEAQATPFEIPNMTEGMGRVAAPSMPVNLPASGRYTPVGSVGGKPFVQDGFRTPEAEERKKSALEEIKRRALQQQYAAVGMSGPQAALSVANPALADNFLPQAKTPRLEIRDGQIVDVESGTAKPISGYTKPAEPPKPVDVPGVSFQFNNALRSHPSVKAAEEIKGQTAMLDAIKAGSPMGAGDIAIIIGFNKVIDPGVAVREGDVALAQSAASLKGRLETFIANAKEGTKMDPTLRADMLDVANRMAAVRMRQARAAAKEIREMAKKHGGDPEMASMGYGFLFEEEPGTTGRRYSPDNPYAGRRP